MIGGIPCRHDVGGNAQHDFDLVASSGRRVALEITTFGGDRWLAFKATFDKHRVQFAAPSLRSQWSVIADNRTTQIKELQPDLEAFLAHLEGAGIAWFKSTDDPHAKPLDDPIKREIAQWRQRGVQEASVLAKEPRVDAPRILLAQSEEQVDVSAAALPDAIQQVFDKGDNQPKLKKAEADERHLFIWVSDWSASGALELPSEPPPCPPDPQGIVDIVWLYSGGTSWAIYRAAPGGRWERFHDGTGEPHPYASVT